MNLQELIDAAQLADTRVRAGYHLTLGQLIAFLREHYGKRLTVPLGHPPMSYRGYYRELAFPSGETPLEDFLKDCKAALGGTFEGYKGGEYRMHERTPLWLSEWGETSGTAITGIDLVDGKVVVHTKQVDL